MKDQNFFERKGWKTSLGFYLTALCSSFGLMNIWRFPYLVIENGGGAFLYVYFLMAAIVGSCFVMAELMMGKMSQRSLWYTVDRLTKDREHLDQKISRRRRLLYKMMRRLGEVAILATVLVLAYYTVISSWVLGYLVNSFFRVLFPKFFLTRINTSEESFFTQFIFCLFHLGICYFYVRRGIRRGLERMGYIVAPLFVGLLIYLCLQSLTLPNIAESIRYLMYPDFTKINAATLNQAFGHMVLTLGLGLGTIMTFGSYFKPSTDITSAGTKMVVFSVLASIVSALILCPMVLDASYAIFGPKLIFQTIPQLIFRFSNGELVLTIFYLALYLSSLVVSTSLLESLVANLTDRLRWSRWTSLRVCGSVVIFFILFPLLGSTVWRHFRWMGGVSVLETVDGILVNFILPVLAVGISLSAYFLLPKKAIHHEFEAKDIEQEISEFYPLWRVVLLWLGPILLIASFALKAIFLR